MDMLTTESSPIPIEMTTSHVQTNRALAEELNDAMRSAVMPVTVFVGFEAVVGFIGNILILYVFLFRYHVCNFKYFVVCLSMIDLTSCLTTVPGEVVTQMFWYVYPDPLICKVKSFFNIFTVEASAMLLLIIAIDRHRKVCYPFGWQIRPRFAKILCLITLCVSFIIAFPCAVLWGTHNEEVTYKGVPVTVTVCEKDVAFWKTDYPLAYSTIVQSIVCIQMFVMLILYVIIARGLLTGKKGRNTKQKGNHTNKERKTPKPPTVFIVKPGMLTGKTIFSDSSCYSSGDELETKSSAELSESEGSSYYTNGRSANNCESTIYFDQLKKPSPNNNLTVTKNKTKSRKTVTSKKAVSSRVRRKTLIMFILTAVFIITTILYLTLLSLIAKGVLGSLTSSGKSVYFFFFRLYFINHMINPFLYGLLDAQFRRVMAEFGGKISRSFQSGATSTSNP